MVGLARRAEDRGFESIWVAETRITRDGLVPLAAIATATERVRLGTGILNVYTRHPVALAISFIALDEIAPGRVLMGLGPGSPLVLEPQGIGFDRPVTRLREYCEVMRPLLRGEAVTYDGQTVTLRGARIEDLLTGTEEGGGTAASMPIWLGVTGPRALELAGEVADGILLNAAMSVDYVRERLPVIERGAQRSGRTLDDIELGMATVVSPHEDSAQGKDGARRFLALYLSLFPNIARETGVGAEFLDSLRAVFHEQGLEAAAPLVGDEIVDRLTAAGTPDECRARIDEYRAAGVQLPVLFPVPGAMELTIEALA
jgi:5,10-methylenetetrahydromethanopterin reductase